MGILPRLAPVLVLMLPACSGVEADPPRSGAEPAAASSSPLRRGTFESRLILTGTLEAVQSVQITAPNVPSELQIRWMEEDGSFVRAGQKVLEFDNSAFASDLEDKKLSARKEEKELRRLEAQSRAEEAEKAFAVDEARIAYEKARLEADVPKELLPLRKFQERQLALERARAQYEQAQGDLETHSRTKTEEIALKKLGIEKTLYEIRVAEEAIEALVLLAPRDGVLVVAEIPWEARKIQEGDNVWPGFLLLRIPDLSSMRVVAQLSDVDDGRLEPGMKAVVTLDAYPQILFEGEVESVPPVAQETSPRSLRRAFTVRVALSETDPELMRPGMAARVEVVTRRTEGVVLAPRSTIDFEEREFSPDACNLFDCIVDVETP